MHENVFDKEAFETIFGHLRDGDAPPSIHMQPVHSGSTRYRHGSIVKYLYVVCIVMHFNMNVNFLLTCVS